MNTRGLVGRFALTFCSCLIAVDRIRAGDADAEAVRAQRRPGRQGRRLGADVAGAGRQDARHGQGHAAGLRHGPRLGRRPDGHHGRQARRHAPWASSTTPTWSSCRSATPQQAGRQRSKATFVKADLFETDFSKATVITMFLLPEINMKLRPKILEPEARARASCRTRSRWRTGTPTRRETISGDCTSWCTAHLWIVPAKVEGTWQLPQGELTLKQQFQMLTGTLGSTPISDGEDARRRDHVHRRQDVYTGKVNGTAMQGTVKDGGSWSATKR